jgi:hypothetical protein
MTDDEARRLLEADTLRVAHFVPVEHSEGTRR